MYVMIALSATTMRLRKLRWIITIRAYSLYTRSKGWVTTRIKTEAQAFLAREYLLREKVQARTELMCVHRSRMRVSFAGCTCAPGIVLGRPPASPRGLFVVKGTHPRGWYTARLTPIRRMARMIDIAVPHTDASYRVMASRPQGVSAHCPPPRSDMSGVGGEADMPRLGGTSAFDPTQTSASI